MRKRKIHKDCPFSEEEVTAVESMLMEVNFTNHCANPPHPTWVRAFNYNEENERNQKTQFKSYQELYEENNRLRELLESRNTSADEKDSAIIK